MGLADTEIAERLLAHLRQTLAAPDLAYVESPASIQGGFETRIFGLRLRGGPDNLSGPLILRLLPPFVRPQRVHFEAAVHEALAKSQYPVPKVFLAVSDHTALGGPFLIMERLAGRPLAHDVEAILRRAGAAKLAGLFLDAPRLLRRIVETWADMQARLHDVLVEHLERALQSRGIDAASLHFDARLLALRDEISRLRLDGLLPALAWAERNRPAPSQSVICHRDFHPLNILADDERVTGVIDWGNAIIAPPEMDLGSTLATVSCMPLGLHGAADMAARIPFRVALRGYLSAYGRRRPYDAAMVRYFDVYHCLSQIVGVAYVVASGVGQPGAFGSDDGIARLLTRIAKRSGVRATFSP
ncbi:MAG TPA: phosphotransferase [Candidatus Cybelea sp.]|nr:phosphotransferase [Candidatus Cybelea sp.]